MRQVIEILRLKHEHHLSIREIARSCGIASSTVGDYLLRAEAAGLEWPLPEGVAAHRRSFQRGHFTTLEEHRPKSHQRYLEWTPSRIIDWARQIGPQCALVVQNVMAARPHPEQGFRSCLGIIRLAKVHGEARLETACQRALHFGTLSYRSIESILDKRLEAQPLQGDLAWSSPSHENVRGQEYFA
jgi:transposase